MTRQLSSGIPIGLFQALCDVPTGDPAIIAKLAEEAGFDSYWTGEHPVMPEGSAEVYPARQAGEPVPEALFKMPDPLIALARASATTETIKLGTAIALVPQRFVLNAAIEVASLDHFSNGRFLYGIGAGWNEPECKVMGGDFAHRWTQTAEAIDAMKKLWTGEYVEHHGDYYDFPSLVCRPTPTQTPHPPIILASVFTPKVLKRVARWGDGWLPASPEPDQLAAGKAEIRKHAIEFGRDPDGFQIIPFAGPDGSWNKKVKIAQAAEAGATSVVLWLQGNNLDEISAEIKALAKELF